MDNNIFKDIFLETNRLILRNFTNEDKNEFFEITRDPLIYETLPEDHMYSKNEISEIIDWFIHLYSMNSLGNIPKFPLAIILKNEQKLIGDIGIGQYSMDKSKMEIFYFINSKYWNKKYMTEALDVFLKYVKDHKLVFSLIGTVVPKNIASSNLLIKNGFIKIKHDYKDTRDMYELKI